MGPGKLFFFVKWKRHVSDMDINGEVVFCHDLILKDHIWSVEIYFYHYLYLTLLEAPSYYFNENMLNILETLWEFV